LDFTPDYKDIEGIRPFLTDEGRIVPSRITRLNRRQQRLLTQAVKRARQLALLPIAPQHGR
jgi:small subunit ribosomal protein S18